MPLAEYAESVGGGLKLKGVKGARVKKHKKKDKGKDVIKADNATNDVTETGTTAESQSSNKYGKTEAQLRHEERKRQLNEERLKKEGVKTHKERVEELNKYLSRLSEHHDMPKIGPG